ncbi:hypothetical protein QYM36_003401 [Artemia franciscana]|uniref:Endonuclease-reverse transcriptase n=1 Tax=Artemia franciscana TaxID=6661 RepID=A0AA88LCF9_ARTSF|nr:hypothetical protein QYM36_003401 [Artemia franciscana]
MKNLKDFRDNGSTGDVGGQIRKASAQYYRYRVSALLKARPKQWCTVKKISAHNVTTGSAGKITADLTTSYTETAISKVTNPASDALPLFTPKTTLAIGTLNVSTLTKEGKKDLLIREINRDKWDIVGLSETHLPVTGVEKIGDTTLLLSGRNDGIHRQGVRIILSNKANKSLISTTLASEHIITIRLKGLTTNLKHLKRLTEK